MRDHYYHTTLRLPVPRARAFAFFAEAENLGVITPPELAFKIRTPLPITIRAGTLIDYTISLHGVPMRWRTRITRWRENEEFEDERCVDRTQSGCIDTCSATMVRGAR